MPSGWAGKLAPCVAPAAQYIARTGGGFDIGALQEWDGAPFGVDPAVDLPRWQALARVLLTAGGDLRARPTKTQGFEAKSAYKDAFLSWLESARPGAGLPPPPRSEERRRGKGGGRTCKTRGEAVSKKK